MHFQLLLFFFSWDYNLIRFVFILFNCTFISVLILVMYHQFTLISISCQGNRIFHLIFIFQFFFFFSIDTNDFSFQILINSHDTFSGIAFSPMGTCYAAFEYPKIQLIQGSLLSFGTNMFGAFIPSSFHSSMYLIFSISFIVFIILFIYLKNYSRVRLILWMWLSK